MKTSTKTAPKKKATKKVAKLVKPKVENVKLIPVSGSGTIELKKGKFNTSTATVHISKLPKGTTISNSSSKLKIVKKAKKSVSMTQKVLAELRKGSLTSLQGLKKLKTMRVSARVWDLRQQGHKIKSKLIVTPKSKKKIVEYTLVKENIKKAK